MVRLDYVMNDREAQAGAIPQFLGGEEGIEDLSQYVRRDSHSGGRRRNSVWQI